MTKVTILIAQWVSEWYWLLNVTCNDISVIYVTGKLKKKLNLRSGSQRQRHFVGFSLQAPIRDTLFTVISRNRPIYSSFTTRWGYGGPILILNPGSPRGDYFITHITNFPFLNINIPPSSGYGVFMSKFIWYARACSSNMFDCFTLRPCHFSILIFSQGYVMKHLESSFGKFNGRYGDPIQQHLAPFSRMLNDNLVHDHIQCHPPSYIHYVNNLRTCYWPLLYYRIWPFYWSSRVFHRTYETGVTCRQRKLILLRIPITDLFMMCTCSRVNSVFPKLVMFPDF